MKGKTVHSPGPWFSNFLLPSAATRAVVTAASACSSARAHMSGGRLLHITCGMWIATWECCIEALNPLKCNCANKQTIRFRDYSFILPLFGRFHIFRIWFLHFFLPIKCYWYCPLVFHWNTFDLGSMGDFRVFPISCLKENSKTCVPRGACPLCKRIFVVCHIVQSVQEAEQTPFLFLLPSITDCHRPAIPEQHCITIQVNLLQPACKASSEGKTLVWEDNNWDILLIRTIFKC